MNKSILQIGFYFVFVILGRAWWDEAHEDPIGQVWGFKKNPFIKQGEFG